MHLCQENQLLLVELLEIVESQNSVNAAKGFLEKVFVRFIDKLVHFNNVFVGHKALNLLKHRKLRVSFVNVFFKLSQ